jgi:hypothetical protein
VAWYEGESVKENWLMIPCRRAHELSSEALDRQLSIPERLRLRLHLGMCVSCTRVDRQMDFMRQALRRLGDG